MTNNENLSADLSDETSDQILRLAKELSELIRHLEEQPDLNSVASYRIASLRYDINSAIYALLSICLNEKYL